MKKLLLAGVAALLMATAAPGAEWKFCTMTCMLEVPLGTENAEAEKKENARCTGVCGTKEACEWVVKNASKHKLRTTGCERVVISND